VRGKRGEGCLLFFSHLEERGGERKKGEKKKESEKTTSISSTLAVKEV